MYEDISERLYHVGDEFSRLDPFRSSEKRLNEKK